MSLIRERFRLNLKPAGRRRLRRVNIALRWLAIGMIGFALWLHAPVTPIGHKWAEDLAMELKGRYGFVLRYGDHALFQVPPRQPFGPVLSIQPLDERNVLTALRGLRSGLAVYPPTLVREHLGAVFLTGILETEGIQIGGTYLHDWVYLSADGLRGFWDEDKVASTLHHEFSSLLFHAGRFPDRAWREANEPAFAYPEDPRAVLRAADERRDPAEAEQWQQAGFVSDYGMSSLENDFNTFAELAFGQPGSLVALAGESPRIAQKLRILIAFYTELEPAMTDHFQQSGLAASGP